MKYAEQGGDVRGTSANTKYMGVVFQGTLDEALAQAKAAPDHGVPALNGRAELLAFLRVESAPRPRHNYWSALFYQVDTDADCVDRDSLVSESKPTKPWDGLSPYSLEYAQARWPEMFK